MPDNSPTRPHESGWHILSSDFEGWDDGLKPPARDTGVLENEPALICKAGAQTSNFNTLIVEPFVLRIQNLDRSDPPDYKPGSVPRSASFNYNVFEISSTPQMPEIAVSCYIFGFDPAETPIYWRLQCRHVLCRHQNQGSYRYRGECEILEAEWQGQSKKGQFTLFSETCDPDIAYDFDSSDPQKSVMGGHAILSVAARPPERAQPLIDYVHLRITGTNPTKRDVFNYMDKELKGRDENIIHMVRAIFAHESGFKQFQTGPQKSSKMTFRTKHHHYGETQPDCEVRFDWPDDPVNFPLVTYDFGVGISQYTRSKEKTIGCRVAWDWRENIKTGIIVFMEALRRTRGSIQTSRDWAKEAWKEYNTGPRARRKGSALDTAEAYATRLTDSAEGQLVSNDPVPADLDLKVHAAPLKTGSSQTIPPPSWPPKT